MSRLSERPFRFPPCEKGLTWRADSDQVNSRIGCEIQVADVGFEEFPFADVIDIGQLVISECLATGMIQFDDSRITKARRGDSKRQTIEP